MADARLSVSEITVKKCFVQPSLAGDTCAPHSTIEQDAIKGKWVRVARDLNLEGGLLSPWLVRRSMNLLSPTCSSKLEYILSPN